MGRKHYFDQSNVEQAVVNQSDWDADTFLYASSDDTPVATSPANVMAALSGHAAADFAMNTNKITGVTDPTAAQDAATKTYADTTAMIWAIVFGG